MNDNALFLSPDKNPWVRDEGLLPIQKAIRAAGGEIRVVGGAVRDAFMGQATQDIDAATTLPPESVIKALTAAGIKVVPTGLAHGTITAIIDHKGYEITTLRRDLQTDGRHATVAYTDDWQEDAARRDFTFNALYLKETGEIVDYFNGREDLAARLVRFIGDPAQRIDEDSLRILRAFRFLAQLSTPEQPAQLDDKALEACQLKASHLTTLSGERLWKEMAALLRTEAPILALQIMIKAGVMGYILPEGKNTSKLDNLIELEKSVSISANAITRLAALLDHGAAASVAKRFRLSNIERDGLLALESLAPALLAPLSAFDLRQKLYENGKEVVQAALLLAAAGGEPHDLPVLWAQVQSWKKPAFPLRGEDLLKQGHAAGPRLGQALKKTEAWWCGQDFAPDHQACLQKAIEFLQGDSLKD
ncbi:MAG: CCA tRNA nucleotidyltransferase [Bdellovibrionales bacterium]|jgi:poly(A) polymerase